jgi:5'-nucleotidase
MNILATNDDGYRCEGIVRLVSALRPLGHRVLMVSPDRERSGSSHSISTAAGYIDIKEIAADTWICAGTPVDCVIAVLYGGLNFNIDVIVSGINAGCNLGTDLLFSGTAAAAREGAMHGYPSIAFSLAGNPPYFWDAAAGWAASHLSRLVNLWQKDTFINVNMPNTGTLPDEPLVTFPSRRSYIENTQTESLSGGWRRLLFNDMRQETLYEAGSDDDAVQRNEISVTPVYIRPVSINAILGGAS